MRSGRPLAAALALLFAGAAEAGTPASGVRLLGTVVSSDAARSLAMVESGGRSRAVRVGEELDGGTVVAINSESVVLRRRGELESLQLASASRPASARGADVPASAAPAADEIAEAHDSSRRAPAPTNGRRLAPRRSSSAPAPAAAPARPRREGESARSNDEMLALVSQQARFAAVNDDNGELRGIAIMNVLGDGSLERLGLRSDDIVTSINGVAIDSSGAALREARGLNPARPVALGIERRGVPSVLQVDLRNLQR